MNVTWFTGLQWAHPWAWGLAALPLAAAGLRLWRASRSRHDALAYADAHLHPWAVRAGSGAQPVWRQVMQVLVGLLLAASLAGPRLPLARTAGGPPQTRHAVNVMVVLDASPGMEAAGPDGVSLMERARLALLDLLPHLRGERLGLTVYGKGAGELLPCTDDMHIFTLGVQQAGPELLQASQSAGLPGALELARRALLRTPGASRAVLLIAGADPASPASARLQAQLRQQAVRLRADGVPVFALLLQQRSWFSRSASRLDADPIERLAQATGGMAVGLDADPWPVLYGDGLARLPSNPIPPAALAGWRELYGIPLLCAMALTFLLAFVDVRRGLGARASALALPIAVSCLLALPPQPAHAQDTDMQAWPAWQAWCGGRYAQAMRLYAAIPGFHARMGEGGSAYRLGAFGPALEAYRRAMLDAHTDVQRAQALFNLGNAAFHLPGHLREAIDAYRASLVLAPADSATLRNLRLAEAQWSQEHPESAITGIRKRGPASHHDHFGVDSGRPPSQMDHKPEADSRFVASDQSLQAGGLLQQDELSRDSRHDLSPPVIDLQPALRKMQLLHDHAAQLLGGLLEQDNRRAVLAVQSTP